MSSWTYIRGVIEVEPMGETQPQKRYILDTILNHLPLVTGSERDMEVYVIQPNGHNESSDCDEFGYSTNNLVDWNGRKTSHGWLEKQSRYLLILDASLRDRQFEYTFQELMKWMTRLSKRIEVCGLLLSVSDYSKRIILSDYEPFLKMFECPSWCNEHHEPAWWEFMIWDKMKDSQYPMILGYKYFDDPENNAEVMRRMVFQRESPSK